MVDPDLVKTLIRKVFEGMAEDFIKFHSSNEVGQFSKFEDFCEHLEEMQKDSDGNIIFTIEQVIPEYITEFMI